ncbi:MAG: MBL fold metallo-hydrolase, partial [Muribaculaceae bacterium]|nr:MBL fold metallo-hydrolase [Muribaculaceae bacterium]
MHADIKELSVYDHDIDLFESQYPVPEGITYNSYIILDDKIALIDTVDQRKDDDWRTNLLEILGDRQPDYLIVQHLEPDHSSQIRWVMERYPECRLICTAAALKMLPLLTDCSAYADRIDTKADGDTMSLGHHELTFVTAPMVHWPEVMMVYDATA